MKQQRPQHRVLALSLIAVTAGVALLGSTAAGWAGAQSRISYPRAQTLITTGTQWGNIAGFNPFRNDYAVGTVGLCNETLLRYDPLADRYINWLAKSAKFTGPRTYTVVIRSGIKWSDGKSFTAKDAAWNFKLGRFETASWHDLYLSLKSIKTPLVKINALVKKKGKVVKVRVKVKGKLRLVPKHRIVRKRDRVVFTFRTTPNYVQWKNLLWNLPMVSPTQWASVTPSMLTSFQNGSDAATPIGTGPYELDPAGYDPQYRVVWKKKAVWWAAKQKLAPSPKPTYIVDLRIGTVGMDCMSGCIYDPRDQDLSNDYVGHISSLVAHELIRTYYSASPYHLSANTTWLTPNTTHKPLDDPVFRKALATSINVGRIVSADYDSLVLPANPTGLPPTWKKWINEGLVAAKGFSYSTSGAISMLRAAGYSDSSGWFVNKDGSPINLKISVPWGWSDWETARDMIVFDAAAAHIKLTVDQGDYNHYQQQRNSGAFDLVIDNTPQLSDNPWTYFDYLFRLPIDTGGVGQTAANFSRYQNPTAWAKTQQLDKTPPGNTAARRALADELQAIELDELPNIPLWYNGIWSQSQSVYWTNWPSSTSARKYIPCMWRGYSQMTGIDMITHLKPGVGAEVVG